MYAKVQGGIEYEIMLDPSQPTYFQNIYVGFDFIPVENDSFSNRTILSGPSIDMQGSTFGQTAEPGEPQHSNVRTMRKTVWYTWTAPDNGWLWLNVQSSDFEPAIAVYDGQSIRKLRRVARLTYNPRASSNPPFLSLPVIAGKTYQIAVDGILVKGMQARPGEFQLELEFTTLKITSPSSNQVFASDALPTFAVNSPNPAVDGQLQNVTFVLLNGNSGDQYAQNVLLPPFTWTPTNLAPGFYGALAVATNDSGREIVSPPVVFKVTPPGDMFSNAVPLVGYQTYLSASLAGATLERGEPRHNGVRTTGSIWYSWTAPQNGTVELSPDFPSSVSLNIYTGPDLRRLKSVPFQRINLGFGGQNYRFKATEGKKFWFAFVQHRVADYGESFDLSLSLQALWLTSPTNGLQLANTDIPFRVRTTIPLDRIASVEYLFDGVVVGSNTVAPFNFDLLSAPPGAHKFSARARLLSGLEADTPDGWLLVSTNSNFSPPAVLTGTNASSFVSLHGESRSTSATAGKMNQIALGGLAGNNSPQFRFVHAPAATNLNALPQTQLGSASITSQPGILRIMLDSGQIKVSWPSSSGGILESASELQASGNWHQVTNTPVSEGGQNVVTLPCSDRQAFFRLRTQ
jgi:hypothetical protein